MNAGFLNKVDNRVILAALLALLLAAAEAGFHVGRYVEFITGEIMVPLVTVIAAAILSILSLLLGFTVSMAVSRFEVRQQLVLAEANALGTSYLRAQLLPAPQSAELIQLLREYVRLRLQYGDVGVQADGPTEGVIRKRTARLQGEFWMRAGAYARDPKSGEGALLLQPLNQAFEMEKARWMAFLNTVPATVIYADAVVALLAMSLVGFLSGAEGRSHIFATCVLALAIIAVLGVIIDLDRPRRGLIQVSQQPMIDLSQQLQEHK